MGEVDNCPKDEFRVLLQTLEQQKYWDGRHLFKYNGFWYSEVSLQPILSSRKQFKAKNTDIILATMPKSGTTWLKALAFSITNRNVYTIDRSPLLLPSSNPHKLVPFLEFDLSNKQENPDLEGIPSPKIFSIHMPFEILPNPILKYECKIIYICPLDQFISERHFFLENKKGKDILELDESFDMFSQGIHPVGPFWDHMLGYWNAHLKNPQKVFFVKYEDLKEDVLSHVNKIGEFLGYPFSLDEEEEGVIEEIARLCSFDNLKNLEANKNGYAFDGLVKNSSFFRKGEVGDWTNYLTPAMAENMERIMETKFEGSGLGFKS